MARTFSPVLVVVAAMVSMTTWWDISGRGRPLLGGGAGADGPRVQSRLGGGRGDGLDDDLVGYQRAGPPVHGDEAEQPVLDPVPLGRAGREMRHGDLQPGLGCQRGEFGLPQPEP